MYIVFDSFKHLKLPISIIILVTTSQIVYINMTAISEIWLKNEYMFDTAQIRNLDLSLGFKQD